MALRDLLHRLDSENVHMKSASLKLDCDLRTNYLMNSKIEGIDDSDLLLLVGCNTRYESPVLNSRIIRNVKRNNLKVGVIGTAHDYNFKYSHLGTTAKTLKEILDGSHPYCE